MEQKILDNNNISNNEQKVLGLDLGSNSIGWALMGQKKGEEVNKIIALGSRIFNKSVEDKTPTPKNQKRREMRLGRRVVQRLARRKQRMANYLISLELLPVELKNNFGQEKLLNQLGDPYALRKKGLDQQLTPYEFGRILLHFVARRGFLSTKKQIAGDLVDDPDTIEYLEYLEELEAEKPQKTKNKAPKADDQSEEGFKYDIVAVNKKITESKSRTLGEYLYQLKKGEVKRNRSHDGGHLRTDRKMYQDEIKLIWQTQSQYFTHLPNDFMEKNKGILNIIFYQRPLKLKKDRVGKCSLEPKKNRAPIARLEVQRYRYLLDINNLAYSDSTNKQCKLNDEQKKILKQYFNQNPKISVTNLKKELKLNKSHKINLETKNLKGNITACAIRGIIGERWDEYSAEQQSQLFEDLFTIKKKSSLKNRLITHWDFDKVIAVKLCLLDFEPNHSNLSLKAIKKLLPYLEQGFLYDEARDKCGYKYETKKDIALKEIFNKLPAPTETSNPIVNKGMHELRRVVNAIIKQYGKPDIVRIEMARDLEMNTKRYKDNIKTQNKNKKANEEAQEVYSEYKSATDSTYIRHDGKLRYRLWIDQKKQCAYSGNMIAVGEIFSSKYEIDHILPFKKSLDDSYMNKVLCLKKDNAEKTDKTPIDAWGNNADKWNQIMQRITRWDKSLKSKVARFRNTEAELQDRDFSSSSLNDTRYISRLAQDYIRTLGVDVNVTKGFVVSKIRHQWGFNSLIGETDTKERTDHRHHTIDAIVIASTSRSLYQKAVKQITQNKLNIPIPYNDITKELKEKLKHVIVSFSPLRKITGGLHEETGSSYKAKHGCLVYRKALNSELNISKIIDNTVKKIIQQHVAQYENKKAAFAHIVLHKDNKTPIKRVRIQQANIPTTKNKTAETILKDTKFCVKDKSKKVFKYMTFGNTHHLEIIKNIKTNDIEGKFVNMMEAHRRAMTGTKSAIKRNITLEPIVKTNHGDEYKMLMVLYINDIVSLKAEDGGEWKFYRVQKFQTEAKALTLRLHTASTLNNKEECIDQKSIVKLVNENGIKKHKVNAIGNLIND